MVLLLNSILAYAIPDVPNNLALQRLREKQLQRELEFYDDEDDDEEEGGDDFDGFGDDESGDANRAESGAANDGCAGSGAFRQPRGRKKSMTLGQALRMRTATGGKRRPTAMGRKSSMVGPMVHD